MYEGGFYQDTEIITDSGIKQIKDVHAGDKVWTGNSYVNVDDVYISKDDVAWDKIHTRFGKYKGIWNSSLACNISTQFLALNFRTWEIKYHTLAYIMSRDHILVRKKQDGGLTFREIYENEEVCKAKELHNWKFLSDEEIETLEDKFKDYRFDIIKCYGNFYTKLEGYRGTNLYNLEVSSDGFLVNGFYTRNCQKGLSLYELSNQED